MASPRRPVRPLLSLQATAIVILTVVVGAWTWRSMTTFQAEVLAPRQSIEGARRAGRTIMTGPYLYLATEDPRYVEDTQDAMRALRAHLGTLGTVARVPNKRVNESKAALTLIEESTGLLWEASPDADLSGALENLARGTAVLDLALSSIEARVEGGISARYDLALQGVLVAWGAMLVAVLGTGVLARRRDGVNEQREARRLRQLNVELAGSLGDAARPSGDDAPPPEVLAVSGADALVQSARDVVAALGSLRETNARIRRSSSFTQDLLDALLMAENEAEVLGTATRAARVAYSDADYQLLLVTAGEEPLLQAFDGAHDAACRVDLAERCPALRQGRTLHHGLGEGIVRCPHLKEGAGCVTCAPVHLAGRAEAVSQLAGYDPSVTLLDDLESLGLALAARLGVVRSLARSERDAATDPLTRLPNRRLFSERIGNLDRGETQYTLLVADIDHFKRLNDEHGHDVGDQCLEIFADVLRDACRASDLPCRYGGEEFVVLLPDVGMRAGLAVAMRIRSLLRDAGRRAPVPFTVSMGVASKPDHGENGEVVLRAADAAMYDAKESGRDQVIPAHLSTPYAAEA